MAIEFKLPWEIPNCGGDEVLCCEQHPDREGFFRSSSAPCSAPQGDDPYSMPVSCCFHTGYPEISKRNCALYDTLTQAVEDVQQAGAVKTLEQFWLDVKVSFDTRVDAKPRSRLDEDGIAKTWTYAKVGAPALKKQFKMLHTLISQITARREQEQEEKQGDGSDSDIELQSDSTERTAFEKRVLTAFATAAKKPTAEKSSRGVSKLTEAQKTALQDQYLNADGASSSSSTSSFPVLPTVAGVRGLRHAALKTKVPADLNPKLTSKRARSTVQDEAEEGTADMRKSQELTNRALEAYLAKNAPSSSAGNVSDLVESEKLRKMKRYLEENKEFLTEEQQEQAQEKVKATATAGFKKLFE